MIAFLTIFTTALAAYIGAPLWTTLVSFAVLSSLSVQNIRADAASGYNELSSIDAWTIVREAFPHNTLTAIGAWFVGFLTFAMFSS